MLKIIQPLLLTIGLSASMPASATPFTAADGMLVPTTDYTLPFRPDGIFDFSSINIGSGITLRFDTGMPNVTLHSLSNIVINGTVDITGINYLTLDELEQTTLSSNICVVTPGSDCFSLFGKNSGTVISAGYIGPIATGTTPSPILTITSIPVPGTLYLLSLTLYLMVLRRCRNQRNRVTLAGDQ